MTNLESLLQRLKKAQREIIVSCADSGGLPPDRLLRKVADLEMAIGAVENLIDEDQAGTG